MEETTRSLLRNAVVEAMRQEQDDAAVELIAMLKGYTPGAEAPVPAITPATIVEERQPLAFPPLPEHPHARGSYFWEEAIEKFYLPTLVAAGQDTFTSHEMYAWIEASGFPLTSGDWDNKANRTTWKVNSGQGLQHLHEKGVVHRLGMFGKTYSLKRPQQVLSPA